MPAPLEAPATRTSTIKFPCRSTSREIYRLPCKIVRTGAVRGLRHFGRARCGDAERPAGRGSPAPIVRPGADLLWLRAFVTGWQKWRAEHARGIAAKRDRRPGRFDSGARA